jgi:arylsulfatase A-like enzyme
MHRRTFLQSAVPLASAAAAPQAAAGSDRPNILWLCTDQQRWDTLSCFGHRVRTPNLDKLAAGGVAFSHAYCQNPICTPSRASFMTGSYPSRLHVHRNGNAGFPADLAPALLPNILRRTGYDCGLLGKLHLSAAEGRVETRPDDGYRIFEWSHHPTPETYWPVEQHAYQSWLRDKGASWQKLYKVRPLPGVPNEYQPGMPERFHEIAWAGERTRAFITGGLKAPWFVSFHIFAPHPPHDPAPEYLERVNKGDLKEPMFRPSDLDRDARFDRVDHQTAKPIDMRQYDWRSLRAAYQAQIEHIDAEVGSILNALERSGQRESTIVIFTSDHGEMLGDHGLTHKGARFYDGAVRVPLILSWPGRFRASIRSDAMVELCDLVPTLLDLLKLPKGEHVQGRSLVSLLTGVTDRHRDSVRSEYFHTLNLPNATRAHMLRTHDFKLVHYAGLNGLGELYDLNHDPGEFTNLYRDPKHSAIRLRLTEQLLDEVVGAADPGAPRIGRF